MAHEQHAPQRFSPLQAVLEPGKGIALYVQLADLFRHRIRSGSWPPGHRLDSFEQIARQYAVARITVRQAVARLVQEGLLTSQRGRGTFVSATDQAPTRTVGDPEFRFFYNQAAQELPPEFLGDFRAADRYVELSKLHIIDGLPFGMIRLFVAEAVYKRFPRRAIERQKVLRLVLAHAPDGALHMRQRMTVEPADAVLAQQLQVPAGSPVAKVLRQIYAADRRLSYAGLSWYRGDAFVMDMTLPRTLIEDSTLALVTPGVRAVGR